MPTLPSAFIERIKQQFGKEATEFLNALERPAKTSVLINPSKTSNISPFDNALGIAWNQYGYLLQERPSFTIDPRIHGGQYYVQESSSMMIGFVLSQLFGENRDIHCIDLCAAPGGKSLNVLNYLNGKGLLVSNEINALRNSILRETLCKWGHLNKVVSKRNTSDFSALNGHFDFVLVDAPCSGEGMFRKDEFAITQWNQALINQCADTQKVILSDAWDLLSEGGFLAFSTCTFAPEENEENARILASLDNCESIKIAVPDSWNLHEIEAGFYGLQFLPHNVPGEGFFISVFRKKYSPQAKSAKGKTPFWKNASADLRLRLSEWMNLSENEQVLLNAKNELAVVSAPSEKSRNLLELLLKNDLATEPGLIVATLKGNDLIPEHGMAMNALVKTENRIVDVSTDIALSYLRRELVDVNTELRGWILLRSEGVILGWVKKMDNRINNYYPTEWRIRKV
jgi:16S rRNA C967 or C1407 C5-methylase (RsmB/RsmF family)/NOL1/NOP2/fmu family ribosome biogenesis protein